MVIRSSLIFFLLSLIILPLAAEVYLKPSPQFKPKIEVAAIFIEHNDEILLLHRQNHKAHGNTWAIPGGKIDKNEAPLKGLIREIKEETCYDFSNYHIENLGTVYIEHNEHDHFIYHMFRTQLKDDPGAVKISFNEHKGFTWVTPADALKMNLMPDEDPCFKLVYKMNVLK